MFGIRLQTYAGRKEAQKLAEEFERNAECINFTIMLLSADDLASSETFEPLVDVSMIQLID